MITGSDKIVDWKTAKWIANPCPVCKAEMTATMTFNGLTVYECGQEGCTGREVRGGLNQERKLK